MRRFAPAAARNGEPIAAVLERVLPAPGPASGQVLEVASGSGQHAVYFARRFPAWTWQPSDAAPAALASIEAWRAEAGLANLMPPVSLDVTSSAWPVGQASAIININMVHIAPWSACQGLMAGAGRLLPDAGLLFLYGPFFMQGRETAPGNQRFDEALRAENPAWGVRWLHEVAAEAQAHGLVLEGTHDMPANNLSVVFRKQG